jgi:hypothetical protein
MIILIGLLATYSNYDVYAGKNEAESGYNISVYIVYLDDMPASFVGNVSKVFEGVSYLASWVGTLRIGLVTETTSTRWCGRA